MAKNICKCGGDIKEYDISNLKDELSFFQQYVTIFATEFDIHFLNMARMIEDRFFTDWFTYLSIYNESWQGHIDNELKENNST